MDPYSSYGPPPPYSAGPQVQTQPGSATTTSPAPTAPPPSSTYGDVTYDPLPGDDQQSQLPASPSFDEKGSEVYGSSDSTADPEAKKLPEKSQRSWGGLFVHVVKVAAKSMDKGLQRLLPYRLLREFTIFTAKEINSFVKAVVKGVSLVCRKVEALYRFVRYTIPQEASRLKRETGIRAKCIFNHVSKASFVAGVFGGIAATPMAIASAVVPGLLVPAAFVTGAFLGTGVGAGLVTGYMEGQEKVKEDRQARGLEEQPFPFHEVDSQLLEKLPEPEEEYLLIERRGKNLFYINE